MAPHWLPAKLPGNCVVRAAISPAFRHEIAMFQQLRSVFLQEPLDRRRARFVRTNVDVADALCHIGNYSLILLLRRGSDVPMETVNRTPLNFCYNPT